MGRRTHPDVLPQTHTRNERNKAGNLAEFFERWGSRYDYASYSTPTA